MQVPGTKDAKDQLGDGPIQNQDSHDTLISLWMFCRSSMLVTLAFDIVLHAYTCMPCSHPRPGDWQRQLIVL